MVNNEKKVMIEFKAAKALLMLTFCLCFVLFSGCSKFKGNFDDNNANYQKYKKMETPNVYNKATEQNREDYSPEEVEKIKDDIKS